MGGTPHGETGPFQGRRAPPALNPAADFKARMVCAGHTLGLLSAHQTPQPEVAAGSRAWELLLGSGGPCRGVATW